MLTKYQLGQNATRRNAVEKRMGVLDGKVALVTGASKDIGAGIAKGLAAAGASVVVNYASSKEGADRVVAEIAERGGKRLRRRVTSRRAAM